ncbi:MAG: hypothetical protein A2017_05240 [Lentisphaerae bacterium GWF2_44_16]|nr:MAG: hypothetical protein A2017_05240 [Lentisphaerae bacterium GWF2_44_16]
MNILRLNPEDYTTKLPRAYYSDSLDMELAENIWNFEVNGLPEDGNYNLRLKFIKNISSAEIRIKDKNFTELIIKKQNAEIPVSINNRILSFDIRLNDNADCGSSPFSGVTLSAPVTLQDFAPYTRQTALENCNLLNDWKTSYKKIMAEDFNLDEIMKMRDEIFDWIATRQILDEKDPHYGAVYSEENKYCFKDAIFAAASFMKRYLRNGDKTYLQRAVAAKDYCFKGQYLNSGDKGKDGAWAAMGIIDDAEGKNFRRITDKWAQASGVDTFIIGIISGELHGMGLPFTESQLTQLEAAVEWNMQNSIESGWFSHHEGMTLTCVNVNSLAASMIYSVHKILMEIKGHGLDIKILNEADLSVRNVLNCQEAIGVYPYRRGDTKRGGKYWCNNFPDNGIGLQAIMYLLKNKYSPFSFKETSPHFRKTALWYLLCSRMEKDRLVLEYRTDEEFLKGLAFGNFTWCRITMMDIISQIWGHIGDTPFWKQFIRCHLRTIRETLWNYDDKLHAPVKASVVPVRLVSWIQQAEWAAFVLDNLAIRYGLIKNQESKKCQK